jgi:hypothetical protein
VESSLRFCGPAVILVGVLLALPANGPAGGSSRAGLCKLDYAYAGAQDAKPRAGVRATIATVVPPTVTDGHVAGWVGVGGPGAGPGGADEWLQAGYSGFDTGQAEIYYELTLPGKAPAYHTVESGLRPSESHLVSVLETDRSGSWRVSVDKHEVSPTLRLPGSNGRFVPQAIGETWNSSRLCNQYAYSFRRIQVAAAPGGHWTAPQRGYVFRDLKNTVFRFAPASFIARSVAAVTRRAQPAGPPLLGSLATRLAGRPLMARCVRQSAAVRESPTGRLLLAASLCQTLVGYAVAEPWAPRARTGPGLQVALSGLFFLRGLARAAHLPAAKVDCRAVRQFYRLFRRLGATPEQALALRAALLRRHGSLAPPLSVPTRCAIH